MKLRNIFLGCVAVSFALAACSSGTDATPCTVTTKGDVTTISCPDGSSAKLTPPSDGTDGVDGMDGEDGTDGVDGMDGEDGIDGPAGGAGPQGPAGENGMTGMDGESGLSTLLVSSAEPAGPNCYSGGIKFESGLDTNSDETLQPQEIDFTNYVCNGSSGLPNGLGGFYTPGNGGEAANALLACESVHGIGNCCNDGCGTCNQLGFHECGTPNCNGSVYWNYDNDLQSMNCGWVDPEEILISTDGLTWMQ